MDPVKCFPDVSLTKDDAHYVMVIHTNGDEMAIFHPIGHVDIYLNGGKSQPNCDRLNRDGGVCSHNYAYEYFSKSLTRELNAFKCRSIQTVRDGDFVRSANYVLKFYGDGRRLVETTTHSRRNHFIF